MHMGDWQIDLMTANMNDQSGWYLEDHVVKNLQHGLRNRLSVDLPEGQGLKILCVHTHRGQNRAIAPGCSRHRTNNIHCKQPKRGRHTRNWLERYSRISGLQTHPGNEDVHKSECP